MSSATTSHPVVLSVTDAASRGVPGLVREAEEGHDIIVSRHGRPVAAVVGLGQLEKLRELEADLRSAALVLTRMMADGGVRNDVNDVISQLGFDRDELESELAADLAAGRE